jgi:hypothetical protein
VFAVILLGRLLKRGRLLADAFWQPAEAITFYIFFPALLVSNTATAKLRGAEVAPMLAALLAGILAVAALTFALRRPLRLDGPAFTSLLQGAIRPNIYVGLAAAQALFGREGLALLSVAVAFAVPLVNVVSVLAMLRWLGRASLPIGLLAVGAGLDLTAIGAASRTVVVASALKLLLLPALTVALMPGLRSHSGGDRDRSPVRGPARLRLGLRHGPADGRQRADPGRRDHLDDDWRCGQHTSDYHPSEVNPGHALRAEGPRPKVPRHDRRRHSRILSPPPPARDRGPVAAGDQPDSRPFGVLRRTEPARRQEAVVAARPDDHQPVLRGVHPYQHLVRAGRQAARRRRHQHVRVYLVDAQG